VTILVTGGAGFIGSNFVTDWLAHSAEPLVNVDKLTYAGRFGDDPETARSNRVHFVHCGIEDTATISRLLREHDIRAVVNFAAETHVDRSIGGPQVFVETNVMGTFHLIEAVRAYRNQLEGDQKRDFRFLQVSTDEVYGSLQPGDRPFAEGDPYRPNSPYAATKAGADHIVRSYFATYDLPAIITNCSNNYGPRQFPEKLIPLAIRHALAGLPIPVYGDGRQVRDWLYVADHCSAIRLVLARGTPGETYNIGGNDERENIELLRIVCSVLDAEVPRTDGRSYFSQIAYVTDRPGHDRRYALDAGKIHRELGWSPLERLETGILKTALWYIQNRALVEELAARTPA
jgi:dTDP-glucose 4,6-dehydratase